MKSLHSMSAHFGLYRARVLGTVSETAYLRIHQGREKERNSRDPVGEEIGFAPTASTDHVEGVTSKEVKP